MPLDFYSVRRDKFEPEEFERGLIFPCCACRHRHGRDTDEPCRTCDHNANAAPEKPVRYNAN